jgi:L-lysine 6-transaminase
MCAFDLPDSSERNAFVKRCFSQGLFVLGGGTRTIRLRPALTVDSELVCEGLGRLRKALESDS